MLRSFRICTADLIITLHKGECGTYGREEKCLQVLVGKPEEERLIGRRRW
jgi:hypothetical protein